MGSVEKGGDKWMWQICIRNHKTMCSWIFMSFMYVPLRGTVGDGL